MSPSAELLLITTIYFIGFCVAAYKIRLLFKKLIDERIIYKRVFDETLELMADRHIRLTKRMYFLNVCDWAYARRTHRNLLGLAYILPSNVMEATEPIDVERYFTDDEVEPIREGLEIWRKDKRTAALCDEFKLRD